MQIPCNFNLKKEVTFTITPPIREVGFVRLTYAFTKDQEPITVSDHFDFKDGKFIFKYGDEFRQDFLVLMGLLEGGIEALENHINHCYQENTVEPLTLKVKNKFLNEEDKEYLNDSQLKKLVPSDVLISILKKVYNNKILKEDVEQWGIDTITREQFPFCSEDHKNDIHFAQAVLKEQFTERYSIFIKYFDEVPEFNLVFMPEEFKQVVAVYVDGGDSFGNWIVASPASSN